MTGQGLFRSKAVQAQGNKLDGDVIIAQPVSTTLLTACLLLAVGILLLFLATSSFHRKETVIGFLQPDTGLSRISAPRPGVVSTIFVRDGEAVQKGQPLMLLTTPEYLSGGQSLNALMADNLKEQTHHLQMRQEQLKKQYLYQQVELEQRIDFHTLQLTDVREQQSLAQKRLTINQARLADLQSLHQKDLLSREDIRQQQELVLNIRQQRAELRAAEQAHRAQLEQLKGELARLPGDAQHQSSLLDSELSRLAQQQLELNIRGQVLITAPMDGVVTNLVAEMGQSVQATSSLVTIVPDDAVLKAVLLIPTRAYGFVRTGQPTRIRFDAFPYQRFGLYEGEISKTSKAIVIPNEIDMPVAIQEPVYRVEATLAAQEISAYGESMPLQAGMLLSADVVLEQRSLLAWLFEPLFSLKGRL